MKLHHPLVVVRERIKNRHLGIPAATKDPVGIEAKLHLLRRRRRQYVMELARPALQLRIVIMISQLHSLVSQRFAQFIERTCLPLQLRVALLLLPAPLNGRGIRHHDLQSQRFPRSRNLENLGLTFLDRPFLM